MEHDRTVELLVAASPWRCIPVMTVAPSILEAHFFANETGRTTYQYVRRDNPEPAQWDVDWTWHLMGSDPDLLNIAWSVGGSANITFEIQAVSDTYPITYPSGDDGSTTFRSKLVPSAHLFPPHGDFPDGWPCEYHSERAPTPA